MGHGIGIERFVNVEILPQGRMAALEAKQVLHEFELLQLRQALACMSIPLPGPVRSSDLYARFETEHVVRPDDIDMFQHVHSSRYLDYVLAARYEQMAPCYGMPWEDFIARLKGLGPSHAARRKRPGIPS